MRVLIHPYCPYNFEIQLFTKNTHSRINGEKALRKELWLQHMIPDDLFFFAVREDPHVAIQAHVFFLVVGGVFEMYARERKREDIVESMRWLE